MFTRNGWKIFAVTLALLNILSVARGDTISAPWLTYCKPDGLPGCVLPRLAYERVARNLSRIVLISSARVDQRRVFLETMKAYRITDVSAKVYPSAANWFDQGRTTGREGDYFGLKANGLEQRAPLSLDLRQTVLKTSRIARSAVLRLKQAF